MTERKDNGPGINLNLNVRGLAKSATLGINEISNRMIREGRIIYKLGLGQSPFPVPQALVNELKVNAHQKDYLPVMGLERLQEAVSDYFIRTQNVSFGADNIMVGPGSKELMFILQLVYYGDLLIPTPSWVSYAPQAHIIGRHIRWIPTGRQDGWHLLPDEFEALCQSDPDRPRLMILNYPSNPTGVTYSAEELQGIAEVARRYRVVLLSDEIYGELHHQGRHVSVARYYPEGTIISSGLSKWAGAGGWRLGVFAFPGSLAWLRDAMAVVASETFTSTSAPIQHAAVTAFRGGLEIEQYVAHSRRILGALGRALTEILRAAGVQVPDPEGGFYLFPDFSAFREKLAARGINTSAQLCTRILEEAGVAFLPGSNFGRPDTELTARLAYVNFDGARVITAAQHIPLHQTLDESFLESWCEPSLNAVRKICAWLQA